MPVENGKMRFEEPDFELALRRLRRRREELEGLRALGNDSTRLAIFSVQLTDTIKVVFGDQSDELQRYGNLRVGVPQDEGPHSSHELSESVANAGHVLDLLIATVAEHQEDFITRISGRSVGALGGSELHPRLAAAVAPFADGHCREAVLNCGTALLTLLKEKSGLPGDGVPLVRAAFGSQPVLALNERKTDVQRDQQDGLGHLLAGAIQMLRNPRAHQITEDDPVDASEMIAVFNFLMKQVDSCVRVEKPELAVVESTQKRARPPTLSGPPPSDSQPSFSMSVFLGDSQLLEGDSSRLSFEFPDAPLEQTVNNEVSRRVAKELERVAGGAKFSREATYITSEKRLKTERLHRKYVEMDLAKERARARRLVGRVRLENTGTASASTVTLDSIATTISGIVVQFDLGASPVRERLLQSQPWDVAFGLTVPEGWSGEQVFTISCRVLCDQLPAQLVKRTLSLTPVSVPTAFDQAQ